MATPQKPIPLLAPPRRAKTIPRPTVAPTRSVRPILTNTNYGAESNASNVSNATNSTNATNVTPTNSNRPIYPVGRAPPTPYTTVKRAKKYTRTTRPQAEKEDIPFLYYPQKEEDNCLTYIKY